MHKRPKKALKTCFEDLENLCWEDRLCLNVNGN